MIKPPKAEVINEDGKRKKVYAYEHSKLEKYCEDLEKQNRILKESVKSLLGKVEFTVS